jgi:hypothetical protein
MERVVAPTEDLVAGLDRSDLITLLDLDPAGLEAVATPRRSESPAAPDP